MIDAKATAQLPLSIMKIETNHAFVRFFNNLCKLMGVADLVIDTETDYLSYYILIDPKLKCYLKLY